MTEKYVPHHDGIAHQLYCSIYDAHNIPADFCQYWRRVIWSGIAVSLIILAVAVMVSPILLLPFGLISGTWFLGSAMAFSYYSIICFALMVWAAFGCIAMLLVALYGLDEYKLHLQSLQKGKEPKPPGLVATKYKAWKDNFCPLIDDDQFVK